MKRFIIEREGEFSYINSLLQKEKFIKNLIRCVIYKQKYIIIILNLYKII